MKVALTPEIHARIVQYVRAGIPPRTAAGAAGVPPKVFGGWMVRGRQTSRGRYRALWDAIVQSEAQFEVELHQRRFRVSSLLESGIA